MDRYIDSWLGCASKRGRRREEGRRGERCGKRYLVMGYIFSFFLSVFTVLSLLLFFLFLW